MVRAKPLSSAYNDILDESVLPTLWQQFAEGLFLIPHDNAHVHIARSMHKWFAEIAVEELDWPEQSPVLDPIEMNSNADCEPGLVAQHQCLTSLLLLWLNVN